MEKEQLRQEIDKKEDEIHEQEKELIRVIFIFYNSILS